MNNKQITISIFGFSFLIVAIAGGYLYTQRNTSPALETTTSSSQQNGIIAVLGANNTFNDPRLKQSTQPQSVTTKQPNDSVNSTDLFKISLPPEWVESAKIESNSPCKLDTLTTTTTYQSGTQTLVVYENTSPIDCDAKGVADSYLDYDYTADNSGIKIQTTGVKQCTKVENPNCPKGDGKISLYIGNSSATDSIQATINPDTLKTYFFSITDSKITGDFNTQVSALSTKIEQIKLK